jgi:photosystem II stability/assembly factor-like uncharacterized protein/regulation of enolase protein 1 (concanavalin A-like superfamily)
MKKVSIFSIFIFLTYISFAQTTPWQALGPIKFPINNVGQINGMGRTTQLKFHPTNPSIIYAASASGGLWKSIDTGNNWSLLGTDTFQRTKLASICIDYTNDNILYLGSGDPNYFTVGSGIYKSTNGGITWNLSNANIGNRMALEIIMSPLDHNTIIAATNDGIWKTTDAGLTWTQKQTGRFLDMQIKPNSTSTTLYAVTNSQFYYSNDMGETWIQTTSGITIFPDLGDGPGSRLAVSKADSSIVYLLMLNNGGSIFKSTNSGVDFSLVRSVPDTSIVGYNIDDPGQGNYNMSFCASQTDPNELYVNCHCIWRSLNGGVNFEKLTSWPFIVHTDMHHSIFSPYFPNWQYNANDGGIWLSKDKGVSWKPINEGFQTMEFYHAAQSPTRDFVIGGTQDNGGVYYHNNKWYTYQGGDVTTQFFVDYTSRQNAYQAENGFRRSNLFGGYDSTYLPSIVQGNDVLMLFSNEDENLAFATKNEIYKTTNLSNTTPTWSQITTINKNIKSISFNPNDKSIIYFVTNDSKVWRMNGANTSTPTYYNISATPGSSSLFASIAITKLDSGVIYMSCGNRMYKSTNSGIVWTNISGTLPLVNIIKVIHDESSFDESIYIATARGVYYRNNTMTDWQLYNKGLPRIADIRDFLIFDDGSINRSLRVAYFGRGVFKGPLNFTNTCGHINNLTASMIGNNVQLNWTENVNTTIAYRRTDEVKWNTVNAGTTNTFLLSGLNGCDEYEIRVRKNCGSDSSFWSASVFIQTNPYPLPAIWTKNDIGAVGLAGSVCYDAIRQSYTVDGSGDDIWGSNDQFYFVHTPFTGNIEASCRVTKIDNNYGWAKAGIMIRESLDTDSRQSMVCLTPGNGVANQYRQNTGGGSGNENIGNINAPVFIKINRVDTVISTYYSFDEISWILINQDTFNISDSAYIGLFSCSHENDKLHTAVFDKVKFSNHPTLSIEEQNATTNFDFSIYPNPASDQFTIQLLSKNNNDYMINILDMSGKVVFYQKWNIASNISTKTIDTNKLASGLYMVLIQNESEQLVKKLVIR